MVACPLFGLTFTTVDIGVNRLAAHPNALSVMSKATRYLLRCPFSRQLVNDIGAQTIQADQLPKTRKFGICSLLYCRALVSAPTQQLQVNETVGLKLPATRRVIFPTSAVSVPSGIVALNCLQLRVSHANPALKGLRPLRSLSSKIGDLSQPRLECAACELTLKRNF